MAEFNFPVDIGNRALQRLGQPPMSLTLGFTDGTKRAAEVGGCYGRLRRAELQANVWRHATRKAALRPIDSNTLLIAPTLWSSTVTYFVGSIVTDALGTYWQSRIPDNLNNQPGQSFAAWEPYFGPLTVSLYDSGAGYFSGELVYTAAGDGTYNVFQSQVTGNALHPALPNQWSANTTYLKDHVVQQFPAWSSLTTYSKGQCVLYTDGNIYASLTNSNLNNVPPSSASAWSLMPTLTLQSQLVPVAANQAPTTPGTTPIDEWHETQTYAQGNFVIFNAAVYLSLAANNTGNFPNAAASTFWVACTGGTTYQSLIDLNIGNSPATAPARWASGTTYALNALVGASDGFIYKSLQNGNVANQPALGANPAWWQNTGIALPWTSVFVAGGGNSQWLQIGGAAFPNGTGLSGLRIIWPLGTGPVSQAATRNIYRLPANYLRRAPQDPAAGRSSFLGAPTNEQMNDWEFDGDHLVSSESSVINLRFVADVQDVSRFPDMFCEGLARRIAWEVCEPLTQSTAKIDDIRAEYKVIVNEAKLANAIDMQGDELPLDDWLTCRA